MQRAQRCDAALAKKHAAHADKCGIRWPRTGSSPSPRRGQLRIGTDLARDWTHAHAQLQCVARRFLATVS